MSSGWLRILCVLSSLLCVAVTPSTARGQGILVFGEQWGSFEDADFRGDVMVRVRDGKATFGIKRDSKPEMRLNPGTGKWNLTRCDAANGAVTFDVTVKTNPLFTIAHYGTYTEKLVSAMVANSPTTYLELESYSSSPDKPARSTADLYSYWKPVEAAAALAAITAGPLTTGRGPLRFVRTEAMDTGFVLRFGDAANPKTLVSVRFPVWEAVVRKDLREYVTCA